MSHTDDELWFLRTYHSGRSICSAQPLLSSTAPRWALGRRWSVLLRRLPLWIDRWWLGRSSEKCVGAEALQVSEQIGVTSDEGKRDAGSADFSRFPPPWRINNITNHYTHRNCRSTVYKYPSLHEEIMQTAIACHGQLHSRRQPPRIPAMASPAACRSKQTRSRNR